MKFEQCKSGAIITVHSGGPRGPKGEQGEVGPKGDTGPQGKDGYTPVKGVDYFDGKDGEDGYTPIKGIDYFDGEKGEQGIQGIQGPKGDKGEQGIQGIQGPKGDKGDKGDQGEVGPKGDKGEKGDPGERGLPGIPGEKGDKGDKGEKGDPGEQGIQGPQGDIGPKGDTGDIESLDAQLITDALGYIPLDEDSLPSKTSDLTNDSGFLTSVTKSDVGLGNVDNVKQMPISGGVLENYTEKLTTINASDGSIDLSLGNVFQHTPSGNWTYSITNPVSGVAHSFTLIINMGSIVRTLTFPASVKWQGGEIPDLSTASKTYVLTFMTVDGGVNWLGMFGGEF